MGVYWPVLALKISITLWLVVLSVWDRLQRRVPNWLVLPAMLAALLGQVYRQATGTESGLLFVGVAWVSLFMLWRVNVLGGADAKLLMTLFALFPSVQFLILLSIMKVAVSLPLLVAKCVHIGLPQAWGTLRGRLRGQRLLPTADELHMRGQPNCWSYALPGVVYLWWAM